MVSNSYLEINTSFLKQNIHSIQSSLSEKTKLVPVLKGDAYGLGAAMVAQVISGMPGVDTLAVSHVSEGIELRRSGISKTIWVLSLPLDVQLEAAVKNDLVITLGSFRQLEVLQALSAKLERKIAVQIKLDTGLHRIGFPAEEVDALTEKLIEYLPYIDIRGVFSHFADDCPEHMDCQYSCFLSGVEKLQAAGIKVGIRHISSSASLEYSHRYDLDAVRVGRRLYMDHPLSPIGGITEVPSLHAYLTDVRVRRAGEALGYGAEHPLREDTRVGVLSVGYGDGIPPELYTAHAPVLIRGREAKLLAVCMDQSFVDLGDIECAPGDEVTFFGYDRAGNFLSSQRVANLIGTHEGCGLTNALLPRVKRTYI